MQHNYSNVFFAPPDPHIQLQRAPVTVALLNESGSNSTSRKSIGIYEEKGKNNFCNSLDRLSSGSRAVTKFIQLCDPFESLI